MYIRLSQVEDLQLLNSDNFGKSENLGYLFYYFKKDCEKVEQFSNYFFHFCLRIYEHSKFSRSRFFREVALPLE